MSAGNAFVSDGLPGSNFAAARIRACASANSEFRFVTSENFRTSGS